MIMIKKFQVMSLRNAEHLQFVTDADKLFVAQKPENQLLEPIYVEFSRLRHEEEAAMAIEASNAKIKEKSIAEHYRDRLHGKLFNYVKSILYDEKDPLFNAAQQVMRVIKETGNPTHLSENAESAMLTTLGNKLEPYRAELTAIGAAAHLDKLLEANREFMRLEMECRDIVSARLQTGSHSVTTVRKRVDPVYRLITDTINAYIGVNGEASYTQFVSDLNTLIARYDALLSARSSRKQEEEKKAENKAGETTNESL
jgi:hypothetical protein